MTAAQDFATVVDERDDREEWITARNALHDALETINQQYLVLKAMADAGIINNAPTALKNTMVWAYTQLQSFRSTMLANTEYMNLHNWTP